VVVVAVVVVVVIITIEFRASFFVWAYLPVLMYIGVNAYEFIWTPGKAKEVSTCN
jgi:hypothetical protein